MNQQRYFGLKEGLVVFIGLISLIGVSLMYPVGTGAQGGTNYSLRFYGHGYGDIDRVKIPIHNPEVPADVGGDFTFEFWMKANSGENDSTPASCGSFNWIFGNIIFDRDVNGSSADGGDYGISMHNGRIRFGADNGSDGTTICGSTNVANDQWRHIAVTRNSSSGQMRIYVDGQQDAQGTGPTGDISYQGGGSGNDPFLVIGAEKHDFSSTTYPSYSGWVDEVRISNVIRYNSNFTPPTMTFTSDANTVALYHFDEGPGGSGNRCSTNTTINDSSGPSDGFCRFGGDGNDGPQGPVFSTDVPSFTTSPTSTPTTTDTTPPGISNVAEESLTETSVTITWDTDEPATSQVRYGLSDPAETSTQPTSNYETSHSVALTGLLPETTYVYEVVAVDGAENEASAGPFNFTTLPDLPPTISNVTASVLDTSTAITWETNEPATSQIFYGISSTSEMSTTETTALTTFHQVLLTGLISETTYLYQVVSRDQSGNPAAAEETFTTLSPAEVSKVYLPLIVK